MQGDTAAAQAKRAGGRKTVQNDGRRCGDRSQSRRNSLIYIGLTFMRKSLYPHKGAFFRGSFFVACPAQKEENQLYIIILQRLRPIPRTGSGKQFAANSREHERERSRKTGRSAKFAPEHRCNALFFCVLHRNNSLLQAFC